MNNYLPSFLLLFFPRGTTPISVINNSNLPRGETTLLFLLNMLLLSFLDENLVNTLLSFFREKKTIRLERNLNTVMLGNLFASSALRQTQYFIKSAYDDQ